MDPVVLTGTVRSFSVKEPKQEESKEPKPLMLKTSFSVSSPDMDILARLCSNTTEAAKALKAAVKAGGEVGIPCRNDTMAVSWKKGGNKRSAFDSVGVTLNRVQVDGRGEGACAKVLFTEPLNKDLAAFLLDMLGKDLEISMVQHQGKLDLKDDEKEPEE